MDRSAGITAKTVIKSLIPKLKHSLKENLKCFIRKTLHRHKWRQIDSSQRLKRHLCLKVFNQEQNLLIGIRYFTSTQPKSYFCRDLMKECLQSNPSITQSLKGQQKLPPSLIHKCKPTNTIKHLYIFFIEPPKGQENINSVLIVFEIFKQISPPHPSINTSVEDE